MDSLSSSGESFEELCIPLRDEMYNFALKLSRGRDTAEDIVQDALVYAMRAWPRWDSQGLPDPAPLARAWLYRIVSNVFTDLHRGKSRRQQLEVLRRTEIVQGLYGQDVEVGPARSTPATEGQDANHEHPHRSVRLAIGFKMWDTPILNLTPKEDDTAAEVLAAVRHLRQPFREIVERAYFLGQSHQDIATALGFTPSTVSSTLHRAREMLRPLLASYARANYGLGTDIGVYARAKASKVVKPKTRRVKRVVREHDPIALVLREAAPYYAAAG